MNNNLPFPSRVVATLGGIERLTNSFAKVLNNYLMYILSSSLFDKPMFLLVSGIGVF